MVLRKPRRNPKTTAEALEALFFPKTIDSIFAQAPRATLFVLRRVCKNWKYRADGCLVRHVVLNGRSKPTSPHGMIPRPNWHTTKLISNVTYLDVSRGPLPKWTKKLSGVLALRRKEIGPDGKVGVTTFRSIQSGHPLPMAGTNTVECLEVTFAFGWACRILLEPILDLTPDSDQASQSLTVVAIPPPTTMTYTDSPGYALVLLLDLLSCHLIRAYACGGHSPITIVNLSAWYSFLVLHYGTVQPYRCPEEVPIINSHIAHTFQEGEEGMCTCDQFIRDGVRRVIDNEGSVPKEKRDEVLSALTFISLAEYGKKVGEQQLRFETELVYD